MMLNPIIPESTPNRIWFNPTEEVESLIYSVLLRIARHQIIIDDPVLCPDMAVYVCHSEIGVFNVMDDGDVEVIAPDEEMASKLISIFE